MRPHDAYEPCRSCQRHVKRLDVACPFCGTSRSTARAHAPRGTAHISRAQWLAFGSTLVGIGIGCNGLLAAEPSDDAGASRDDASIALDASVRDEARDARTGDDTTPANDDAPSDAAPEVTQAPSPDASCPRGGTFRCGSQQCARATELCLNSHCVSLGTLASIPCAVDSGACAACPTCACMPPSHCGSCNTGSCLEDNFGGLTVTLTCSEGGCYGSPPARLDRAPFVA